MFVRSELACHSIEDLRAAAQRKLPRMVFDYVDGGAQSESTMRGNRIAWDRYRLLASAPVNVHERTLGIQLLGSAIKMPIVIGPTGFAAAIWPGGDVALARAAARFGVPFVISNGATATLEEITAAASGRVWLQIYLARSRDQTARLLARAKSLGIEAIEVTVDTAVPGRRLRDIRNGFGIQFKWNLANLTNVLCHPRWALRILPHGTPQLGLMQVDAGQRWETVADFVRSQINPAVTWDDLKWLRDQWQEKLIVKGLIDPGQMENVLGAGYDSVVVSNHGGRQLDGAAATADVLPEFVAAAAGKIPVLIDSGFRSGTDVLKALALGAGAVQIGRAALYGLAVAGEAGVDRALSIFQLELDLAMALTGVTDPRKASPKLLRVSPWIQMAEEGLR
jgi:(S)-mandelate dehydrogenase